jgi:hypothetical protein
MSASATTASNSSGRSPSAAWFNDADRPAHRSVEPERRDPIGLDEPILRAENHPLQVCLGDYQPIEWIVMVTRQPSSVLGMAPGDRQNLEPEPRRCIDN